MFIFCFIFISSLSHSKERITRYDVVISIKDQGALHVVENITVKALGQEIKRGIYRDYPIKQFMGSRRLERIEFNLLDVQRNGQPEPWAMSEMPAVIRTYIGDQNKKINMGEHTYRLEYTVNRQIRFKQEYDELYYNAIAHGFSFPIESASVKVIYPNNSLLEYTAFTGAIGSKDSDVTVQNPSESSILYTLTKPLGVNQGVTIGVKFKKGAIEKASPEQYTAWLLSDFNRAITVAKYVLFYLIALLCAWLCLGVRLKKGIIIPQFSPPKDISPALCHLLTNRKLTLNTFVVATISLISKEFMRVTQQQNGFTLHKNTPKNNNTSLSQDEEAIYTTVFSSLKEIRFSGTYNSTLSNAKNSFFNYFIIHHTHKYIAANRAAILLGVLFFSIFIVSILISDIYIREIAVLFIVGLLFSAACLAICAGFVISIFKRMYPPIFVLGVFSIFACYASYTFLMEIFAGHEWHFEVLIIWLCIVISIFALVVFCSNVSRLTPAGQKLLDQINGFKWYLTIAEKETLRHQDLTLPSKTPKLYQQNLPYALALGVENAWSAYFSEELSNALTSAHP